MSTLNVYSNAGVVNGAVLHVGSSSDRWVDLGWGFAYSLMVTNNTDADITSGTISVEVADASEDNPCVPGIWGPLPPVQDCGPIVSGVPYGEEVTITITEERPIKARSSCSYSIPCPKQFMRVTGAPAGTDVVAIQTRPRRSDYSHLGPYGSIPPPAQLSAPFGGAQAQHAEAAQPHETRHHRRHEHARSE